jgi:hypothetical protein
LLDELLPAACCDLATTFSAFHRRRAAAGVRCSSTTLQSTSSVAGLAYPHLHKRSTYLLLS